MSSPLHYTVYRFDKDGDLVHCNPVTGAADIAAFETARGAVIRDREELLSSVCMPNAVAVEDAA